MYSFVMLPIRHRREAGLACNTGFWIAPSSPFSCASSMMSTYTYFGVLRFCYHGEQYLLSGIYRQVYAGISMVCLSVGADRA